MTSDYGSKKKVRFIKPPNILKQKVGFGGIPETRLIKSQEVIDSVQVDFVPYANDFLNALTTQIKEAKKDGANFDEIKDSMIRPVMQLKASGGMFHYQLISDIADIALQFLEAIEDINKDSLDVISAHEKTMRVIINNKLEGNGGKEGDALIKELDQACKRYFAKHPN